jgi:hypothetical protein
MSQIMTVTMLSPAGLEPPSGPRAWKSDPGAESSKWLRQVSEGPVKGAYLFIHIVVSFGGASFGTKDTCVPREKY